MRKGLIIKIEKDAKTKTEVETESEPETNAYSKTET